MGNPLCEIIVPGTVTRPPRILKSRSSLSVEAYERQLSENFILHKTNVKIAQGMWTGPVFSLVFLPLRTHGCSFKSLSATGHCDMYHKGLRMTDSGCV